MFLCKISHCHPPPLLLQSYRSSPSLLCSGIMEVNSELMGQNPGSHQSVAPLCVLTVIISPLGSPDLYSR